MNDIDDKNNVSQVEAKENAKIHCSAANIHAGHRERLKDRFLKSGLSDFEPHNVLELLLCYADPRKDVNEQAHELINRFGSLRAVFNADYNELIKVKGIKKHTAVLLKMIPDLVAKYEDPLFSDITDNGSLKEFLTEMFAKNGGERTYLLCFDDKNALRYSKELCVGELSAARIDVRSVAQTALRLGYTNVALAHNHPGGLPVPSLEDIDITYRLRHSLSVCGITLCEHFIIAGVECCGTLGWREAIETGSSCADPEQDGAYL